MEKTLPKIPERQPSVDNLVDEFDEKAKVQDEDDLQDEEDDQQ